jgi:hypothetical protein
LECKFLFVVAKNLPDGQRDRDSHEMGWIGVSSRATVNTFHRAGTKAIPSEGVRGMSFQGMKEI